VSFAGENTIQDDSIPATDSEVRMKSQMLSRVAIAQTIKSCAFFVLVGTRSSRFCLVRLFALSFIVLHISSISGCANPRTELGAAIQANDIPKATRVISRNNGVINDCDALMLAVAGSRTGIFEHFANKANRDCRDSKGRTALMEAARQGRIQWVYILVDAGVNLDLRDSYGDTAIDLANLNKHPDIANYIIKNGGRLFRSSSDISAQLAYVAEEEALREQRLYDDAHRSHDDDADSKPTVANILDAVSQGLAQANGPDSTANQLAAGARAQRQRQQEATVDLLQEKQIAQQQQLTAMNAQYEENLRRQALLAQQRQQQQSQACQPETPERTRELAASWCQEQADGHMIYRSNIEKCTNDMVRLAQVRNPTNGDGYLSCGKQ
jgi:hypothetical protein